jgi:hypothetical protein
MARFINAYGIDTTYQYAGNYIGIHGNGSVWLGYSSEFNNPVTFWDGVYTIALVNLLVIGYKFTGDRNFLDATPVLTKPGVFPAKYCFERGTKSIYGELTKRLAPDGVVDHFVDTQFDTSTENIFLFHNRGELQYTYLIFENGGAPTVV